MFPSWRVVPQKRLFVPVPLWSKVIHWGYTSPFAGYPGIKRTIYVINQLLWWLSMEREVREYVAACPVCTQNKIPQYHPSGFLCPLVIPHRPWSDISLDFIGLLPSEGNTTVLIVVDQFSKMVHFIPLPKVPLARGMA